MKYHEAIGNAISKIEIYVSKPTRLLCDVKKKSVEIFVMIGGAWENMGTIEGFDNVSHLEVEKLILGAIENASDEE